MKLDSGARRRAESDAPLYELITRQEPGDIAPQRIAMVGDTLHTDVLGGAAAGLGTILIQEHGLFRGLSPAPFIEASGLQPDWLVQST